MANNLDNIPKMLRIIARQIETGELSADTGVLSLRKRGQRRPVVFGFGTKCNGVSECGRAALEILRLAGQPEPTREQTKAAIAALNAVV